MSIVQFLLSNWDSVLIITVVVIGLVYLIIQKQYTILDKIIFALVTEAEKKYGDGTGSVKLAAVIEWVYPKIPAIIRLFISADKLTAIIDRVLKEAKANWEKNPNIKEYVEGKPIGS